jgi:hypothetical protein
MQITLKNLPKISLNEWYAGKHWTKRKQLKDAYKLIVKSQFKDVLSKEGQYEVDYMFCFKSRPLDASNCVAMVKLIEDIMFEDDKYNIVLSITISSMKVTLAESDYVVINIKDV